MWAAELAERLRSRGVDVNWFHPGAVNSQLGDETAPCVACILKAVLSCCIRTPAQGAILGLFLAGRAEGGTGEYFQSGNVGRITDFTPQKLEGDVADPEARKQLWTYT